MASYVDTKEEQWNADTPRPREEGAGAPKKAKPWEVPGTPVLTDELARPRRGAFLRDSGRNPPRAFIIRAMRLALAAALLAVVSATPSLAQAPRPFPGAGAPPDPPKAAAPSQTAAPAAPKPAAAPAPAPATTAQPADPLNGPPSATVVFPIFPGAQFLASYNAGMNQRYYLYGTRNPYLDVVTFYRDVLKDRGAEVFTAPPTHMFQQRFREESMAFPPGVTVKDWTYQSKGYPNPRPGVQPERFPTVIMIVPPPPAVPAAAPAQPATTQPAAK